MSLSVRFWGVRGSIACPSPDHVAFGGNTSCVEIYSDTQRVILDAGTGLRVLGDVYMKDGQKDAVLLLSHTHWDHINGFPFFAPIYRPDCSVRVLAGHVHDQGGIRSVFNRQLASPVFPVPLASLRAKLSFEDFKAGESFTVGDLEVRTAPLNHPDNATGYRIESAGRSICYVTDTEHTLGKRDETIVDLIRDADLFIYDCTYTDDEYPKFAGWGHSTWQEGVRLSQAAGVKQLAIFHHAPEHTDEIMSEIEQEAQATWEHAFVAREGMTRTLP